MSIKKAFKKETSETLKGKKKNQNIIEEKFAKLKKDKTLMEKPSENLQD